MFNYIELHRPILAGTSRRHTAASKVGNELKFNSNNCSIAGQQNETKQQTARVTCIGAAGKQLPSLLQQAESSCAEEV